jgi:hypothetical protein
MLDESFPHDQSVQEMLVLVRSVRWVDAYHQATAPDDGVKVGYFYRKFMELERPNDEWPEMLNIHLRGPGSWADLTTAEEILSEIRDSDQDSQKAFLRILDRYSAAAKAYLKDIVPNEWQTYLIDRFRESREISAEEVPGWTGKVEDEAFGLCHFLDEKADVSIRMLMERLFIIQEIKNRLSNKYGKSIDDSAETQRASGLAKDHRGFAELDNVFKTANNELRVKMIRFFPRKGNNGRPKRGEQTKIEFMQYLETLVLDNNSKPMYTGGSITRIYDAWAHSRHRDLINSEK